MRTTLTSDVVSTRRRNLSFRARRSTPERNCSSGTNGVGSSRRSSIVSLRGEDDRREVDAQGGEGAVGVLLHGARGGVHRRGDLALGKVREIAQRDRFSLPPGETSNGFDQPHALERE